MLLDVDNLRTYFHSRHGTVRAVDGVSFSLGAGETLGVVGESGCGKSVMCMSLLGLIPQPPGRIESGRARFGGVDLLACSASELRAVRGCRISMVFQDPMTSLNPYLRVSTQVVEPLLYHKGLSQPAALEQAIAALDAVGIPDAARRIHAYPYEFSGGMRQRVMIAMALVTRPEILIADEPTTALDVTVQAQILERVRTMQRELGTAMILVTHDLGVVAGVCDRILVMYAGRIVESGTVRAVFGTPAHPYTAALQKSIPALHRKGDPLYTIGGQPPDLRREIAGCAFAERCEFAVECCQRPVELRPLTAEHWTACTRRLAGDITLPGAGTTSR
ncbi:MAG: dipeptide/oligopeptide/nickel ABC transporter ATP-binding protein [Lentisphaerae bacterium RIFOXYB12_FULL_65_16]|nr:MAG: dipeptide/oligopeptide/nickel ABC transporter ATP-binding protein [Lentisphaerae bacterium RIFOXYA12_64_32]OGV85903.1 MAG: dipeptide/oligopeptide/nickel ABC transporter ATP-binding protein [Lentisphaerae bacterium RIFOXYB12_FULL_65_16]